LYFESDKTIMPFLCFCCLSTTVAPAGWPPPLHGWLPNLVGPGRLGWAADATKQPWATCTALPSATDMVTAGAATPRATTPWPARAARTLRRLRGQTLGGNPRPGRRGRPRPRQQGADLRQGRAAGPGRRRVE
jgi:hypothetical protein